MPHRSPLLLAVTGLSLALPGPAASQAVDTATALAALRDARAACTADGGALWGRSLCGPIALVDRGTRLVIANDTVAGRAFVPLDGVFVTTLPAGQFVANTAFTWGGRTWTLVALPLPHDRYSRIALVMHEVFHREQGPLGLQQADALNNHLDERAGRTWLRLEYRALAAALDTLAHGDSAAARRHAEAALVFRAYRRALAPGADSLEATLEVQEGLPEYTGQRLAMQVTGEGPARVAAYVRDYERTSSFVRAFAYGTGPALGVLLDAFAPAWRTAIRTRRDPGALLAQAIRFRVPRALRRVALSRAAAYGLATVNAEEAARDAARAPILDAYRARLERGPTITLRQSRDSLSWGFDPTALVAFDLHSTVYPSGTFAAPWGRLEVDSLGVLVRNDFSTITVAAPAGTADAASRRIAGPGWTLTLGAGWNVTPDPTRAGSYVVSPAP